MKRLGIFTCVLLMVISMGCGGGDDDFEYNTGKAASKKKDRVDPNEVAPEERPKGPPQGWIKKISYSKKLGKEGTALKFKVETTKPLEENQYLSYIYWKNQEKILESPLDTLPPASYKKGDLVYVDVALYQEGLLLEQRRSEMLQIENSSPIFKEVNIPGIEGPGVYRIEVKAHDPDGDELTFSLEGDPLPEGLKIDSHSGSVVYILGEKPPPENVKFTITADDGDKGVTKKIVTIKFNITRPEERK